MHTLHVFMQENEEHAKHIIILKYAYKTYTV